MAIRKRSNGEGSVYQRKDGRWVAALKGKQTTRNSKKEAQEALRGMIAAASRGEPETVKRMTVENYIQNYLEHFYKKTVKIKTYERNFQVFKYQIVPNIGHLQMNAVKVDDVQTMINKIYSEKSYSTTKKAYELVNACFKRAVQLRELVHNPCIGAKLPKKESKSNEQKELFYYSDEQVKAILKECTRIYKNGTPVYRYGYVIPLLLNTGMREGELLYLKWKNVDFEKNRLYICGDVVETKGGLIEQHSPKTKNSFRYIQINTNAKAALLKLKEIINDDTRVVATAAHKIVCPSTIRRMMGTILSRCNVKDIQNVESKVHALRHTFATRLLSKGIDIKVVSEILGHADVSTTYNTYIHVIEEQKQTAVTMLDNIF